MKALVYTGKQALEYRDAPDPSPQGDDCLIRVSGVGICGSDMHAYLGHDERRPAPLILGHEAAGVVVAGPGEGRRVTANPLVSCMRCAACTSGRENLCPDRQIISMLPRQGAFAQYVCLPQRNLVEIPDGFAEDRAALAEPLACGWHAVRLAADALHKPAADNSALVIGAGAIGVGAALALRANGFASVTVAEAHEGRREFSRRRIALNAVHPDALEGSQFDLAIDAVGLAVTRKAASSLVKPGGVIVHIGLGEAEGGLDIRRMTLQEVTFIGTYTYTMQDFRDTAQAMFDGRLGPLDWCEFRPLSKGGEAFADLHNGKVDAPKIILNPDHA